MQSPTILKKDLSLKRVVQTWWPLAASWMLMGMELPALSAVIARLPQPEINLAAYGGIVFPLILIIESPIIMLLAASTALSKDWASYQRIHRFMMVAGALLTGLHILVAFTPLYYVVVVGILGAPEEIVEPARIGLMILTPWTWSIAYRRFNQGVLIRSGHSKKVGFGTVVRLSANVLVLTIGFLIGSVPGIVVGSTAVACGVVSEAIYVGLVVQPELKNNLRRAPVVEPALSWKAFFSFYLPLVMTSLLTLIVNPIGSAALSRMPGALDSLAVWPVISGLIFILRSLGIAYNEVVVALLDEPRSYPILSHFSTLLGWTTTGLLVIFAATPLSQFWFSTVSALPPDLAELAERGLWIALPLPILSVLQSWYQGAILFGKQTRGITESVVVYLLTSILVLGLGIWRGNTIGLYVGLLAFSLSMASQTGWLYLRAQAVIASLKHRDLIDKVIQPAT
jgi:progressive ankylosis protein